MRYTEFRDVVRRTLRESQDGLTWRELRTAADLPHTRACPTWTARLEREIGLTRERGSGRAKVWRVPETTASE